MSQLPRISYFEWIVAQRNMNTGQGDFAKFVGSCVDWPKDRNDYAYLKGYLTSQTVQAIIHRAFNASWKNYRKVSENIARHATELFDGFVYRDVPEARIPWYLITDRPLMIFSWRPEGSIRVAATNWAGPGHAVVQKLDEGVYKVSLAG